MFESFHWTSQDTEQLILTAIMTGIMVGGILLTIKDLDEIGNKSKSKKQ